MSIQKKNQKKGFTLVEVIVVAVIVAILAAVAIPIYQNYVNDSRTNSAANAAGALASFAGACSTNSGALTGLSNQAYTASGTAVCTYDGKTTSSIIPAGMTVSAFSYTAGSGGSITVTHSKGGTGTTIAF